MQFDCLGRVARNPESNALSSGGRGRWNGQLIGEMHPSLQFMTSVEGTNKAKSRLDSVDLILRHRGEQLSTAVQECEKRFLFHPANFLGIYGTPTIIVNRE